MKRIFACLLILVTLFSLVGCNRISIRYEGNATLNFCGKWIYDDTRLTQVLTEEETKNAKKYLSEAKYSPGVGGCPFDEDVSIVFGDQVFAIAYDDCPCVYLVGSDKYYTMSEEGRNYIVSLYEKYVGYFPFP